MPVTFPSTAPAGDAFVWRCLRLSSARTARAAVAVERRRALLLLALPVLESRPAPREHDRFAFGARGGDLLGIGVMHDVGRDHRRQHEHADRRFGAVDDLMRALLAARKADDVALRQDLLSLGRA